MERLIVITPVSRPDNLIKIYKSLAENNYPISVDWHIVFDAAYTGNVDQWKELFAAHEGRSMSIIIHESDQANAVAGHYHRNFVIDKLAVQASYDNTLQSAWIYHLDDDNIMHSNLLYFLYKEYNLLRYARVLLFDQVMPNGKDRLIVNRDQIKVGFVDTAMMLCRFAAIGSTRFDVEDYCADGKFIASVYKDNYQQTVIYNQPLCYYNYLRP